MRLGWLWMIIMATMLASCFGTDVGIPVASEQLVGTTWQLRSIQNAGRVKSVDPQEIVVLTIRDSSRIQGEVNGLCSNSYTGKYGFLGSNGLIFESLSTTEQGCSQGSIYFEFWHGLASVTSFEMIGVQLNLVGSTNQPERFVLDPLISEYAN